MDENKIASPNYNKTNIRINYYVKFQSPILDSRVTFIDSL